MFYSDEAKKKVEDLLNDPRSKTAPMTYELGAKLYDEVGKVGNMVQILAEAVLKLLEQQSQSDEVNLPQKQSQTFETRNQLHYEHQRYRLGPDTEFVFHCPPKNPDCHQSDQNKTGPAAGRKEGECTLT